MRKMRTWLELKIRVPVAFAGTGMDGDKIRLFRRPARPGQAAREGRTALTEFVLAPKLEKQKRDVRACVRVYTKGS